MKDTPACGKGLSVWGGSERREARGLLALGETGTIPEACGDDTKTHTKRNEGKRQESLTSSLCLHLNFDTCL